MGLDITLGALVLLAGIRGWLKGFLIQAIHLVALISCVFLADPLRDLARPYVKDYFPNVESSLIDRFLWWAAAVLGYLLVSGIPISLVRLYRKRPAAELEPRWGDYGAGFLLGLAKGVVGVAFLVWGFDLYAAPRYVAEHTWVSQQIGSSRLLPLARSYRPAERIWASEPVRLFVQRVKTRGLGSHAEEPSNTPETPPPISAQKTPQTVPAALPRHPILTVPATKTPDPKSSRFLDDLDAALASEGLKKSH